MIPKWARASPWGVFIVAVLALGIAGVIIESCNR
jgi:hypothetical protein